MSYQALYRKWRPTDFEEVRGQDHIVRTLKNQIRSQRIGHAYLFCGTRGTGKTTAAKIFARAVNCESPVDGNPCGVCPMCRAIASQSAMNVIEIDAASNNGVDSIRQIREEVSYSPTEGKYKVYIIDEVHMLSAGAFNALLKTLEEPPSYVVFILATTEPNRIPVTILSRCQRYDFRRISADTISDRLQELIAREGLDVEEKAVRYIARTADGSMRDALSLLDQCAAFYMDETLSYEKVLEVLGAVDTSVFSRLLRSIEAGQFTGAVQILEEVIAQGRDLTQFVTDFIWYLRNLLLSQGSRNPEELLDISSENLKALREEARMIEPAAVMRYIRIFSELLNQLRYSTQKRVLIEVTLVKLCQPPEVRKDASVEEQMEALTERIAVLERRLAQVQLSSGADGLQRDDYEPGEGSAAGLRGAGDAYGSAAGGTGRGSGTGTGTGRKSARGIAGNGTPKALPEDLKLVVEQWDQIIAVCSDKEKGFLKGARVAAGEDGKLFLKPSTDLFCSYFKVEENRGKLEALISRQIGKSVELVITGDKDIDKGDMEFMIPGDKIHLSGVDFAYI